jgi:hypothetical protein
MEGKRIWRGRVKPDAHDEHERFVTWLNGDEAKLQYSKFLLTGYSLAERDGQLTVTLAAEEPPPIIRFLRNPRMWPEFWEFESAGPSGQDADGGAGTVRVQWRRDGGS